MGRIVRAILIDPFKCSVTVVDQECAGEFGSIYKTLSHETMRVSICDIAYPDDPFREGDVIFFDYDGMMSSCSRLFRVPGHAQPITGKGLVLGTRSSGETAHCLSDLASIRRATVFFERIEGIGLVRTFTPWTPRHAPSETATI